ncbi:SprB repeat-containing protein, partial [Flavobacterium sp. ZB4R12]|uniref:SprB repeat-containing protein n=1 Tax=Flavobacterium sp. ZB4R12 TaxID=3398732 RepID=UPI003AAFF895
MKTIITLRIKSTLKLMILILSLFFTVLNSYSQTPTLDCSKCNAGDFTFEQYFLGDDSGTPLSATCSSGSPVNAYIWMNVTSSNKRYSLKVDYDLKVTNPVTNSSTTTHVTNCLYEHQEIPNTLIKLGSIAWTCGNVMEISNFFMSWKQNKSENCSFDTPRCICLSPTIVNAPLSINYTQNNVSCFNGSNGSINISVTGGAAPYSYNWTGTGVINTNEDQSGLTAGTYNITATDSKGTQTSKAITITQPATALALAASSKTDATCFGASTGTVTAGTVTNAVGTVTYSWKNA